MSQSPVVGNDGEGVYPHSYERLGAQRGWHISVVFLDPSRSSTTPRNVTVQAICGFGVIPATPTPHVTAYLRPGETKTVTARCPSGQSLVSGGFQRTDFRSTAATTSPSPTPSARTPGSSAAMPTGPAPASSPRSPTAPGRRSRSSPRLPPRRRRSASGGSTTPTTPACPKGKRMVTGGFSSNDSTDGLFSQGVFNPDGTFSATLLRILRPCAAADRVRLLPAGEVGLTSARLTAPRTPVLRTGRRAADSIPAQLRQVPGPRARAA